MVDGTTVQKCRSRIGFAAVVLLAAGPTYGQAKATSTAPAAKVNTAPVIRPATTTQAAATVPAGFERVVSRDGRVAIAVPAGWRSEPPERADDPIRIVVRPKEDGDAVVTVAWVKMSRPATAEQLAAFAVARDKARFPDYRLVENGRASLGALPAWRLVYERGTADGPRRMMQVIAVREAESYIFMYDAPAARQAGLRATADRVAATFQLSDPPPAAPAVAAAAPVPAAPVVAFARPDHGLTMSHPAGWIIEKTLPSPAVVLIAYPRGDETTATHLAASVMVAAIAVPAAERDVMRNTSAGAADGLRKRSPGMKVVDEEAMTVAGLPARRVTLAGTADGRRIRVQQVAVARGRRAYLFTGTADAADFPAIEADLKRLTDSVRLDDAK